MAAEVPRLRYMPALDGLRGIAVIGVILFHAGLLRGGFLGVDLFFVLSGFLITSLLLSETATGDGVRLGRFWARRARRLLPALLMVLAAVALYARTAAAPTELVRIRGDGLAALFYYANWHALMAEQRYWDLFSAPSPLVHTWSLAIEEQFYLLWPMLIAALSRLAPKRAQRTLGVACAAGAIACWIGMALSYAPDQDSSRLYFGTDTRACALLVGAALASALLREGGHWDASARGGRRRDVLEAASLVALGVLGAAWWSFDGQTGGLYRGGFAVCQLATAVLLAMSSHPEPGPLARALSWGPLRYVGTISYGLYLWHWPVFVVVSEARLGIGGPALLALRVGLSAGLAIASYHLVEQRIRGGMRGRRALLIAVGAVTAVTGSLVVATEPRAGPVVRERRWLPQGPAPAPPLRLIVAGDSVAERLAAALTPLASRIGVVVVPGAAAGCGLIDPSVKLRRPDGKVVTPSEGCAALRTRWTELPEADAALLVLGAPSQGDYQLDGAWQHACEPAFDAHFEANAALATEALASRATEVHLVTMPQVVADGYGDDENRRTGCLNRALVRAAVQRSHVHIVDLAAHVCPRGRCASRLQGVLLRQDGQHFEGEGAELIGWWLVEQVRSNRALSP